MIFPLQVVQFHRDFPHPLLPVEAVENRRLYAEISLHGMGYVEDLEVRSDHVSNKFAATPPC